MINTLNKVVACAPPQVHGAEKVVKGGFAMVDKKVQLQELKVVFPAADPDVEPPDSIWVKAELLSTQPWAKETFKIDDVEFILVPSQYILVVKAGKWQSGC